MGMVKTEKLPKDYRVCENCAFFEPEPDHTEYCDGYCLLKPSFPVTIEDAGYQTCDAWEADDGEYNLS
jgi:hypothetical protein